jgi:hypothetical protein
MCAAIVHSDAKFFPLVAVAVIGYFLEHTHTKSSMTLVILHGHTLLFLYADAFWRTSEWGVGKELTRWLPTWA